MSETGVKIPLLQLVQRPKNIEISLMETYFEDPIRSFSDAVGLAHWLETDFLLLNLLICIADDGYVTNAIYVDQNDHTAIDAIEYFERSAELHGSNVLLVSVGDWNCDAISDIDLQIFDWFSDVCERSGSQLIDWIVVASQDQVRSWRQTFSPNQPWQIAA